MPSEPLAACPFPHPSGSNLAADLSHDVAESGEQIFFVICGCGAEGPKAENKDEALELWSRDQSKDRYVTIREELESAQEGAGTPDSILSLTAAVAALARHLRLLDEPSFNIEQA